MAREASLPARRPAPKQQPARIPKCRRLRRRNRRPRRPHCPHPPPARHPRSGPARPASIHAPRCLSGGCGACPARSSPAERRRLCESGGRWRMRPSSDGKPSIAPSPAAVLHIAGSASWPCPDCSCDRAAEPASCQYVVMAAVAVITSPPADVTRTLAWPVPTEAPVIATCHVATPEALVMSGGETIGPRP